MTMLRKALPLTFVAAVSLTGCTMTSGGGGSSSSSSTSTQSTSESPSSTSSDSTQSSPSSESSTSQESTSSDTSSPSSSPSESSTSKKVTSSELSGYAASNTARACAISELSYNGTARFCGEDHDSLTAKYKGQQLYFTIATKYQKNASYTYTVSNGSQSMTKTLPSASVPDGEPATIAVYVPMSSSGTYDVVVKRNGSQLASKSVKVTVD